MKNKIYGVLAGYVLLGGYLPAQIEVVSGGNVGIGTASPASLLHLSASSRPTLTLETSGTTPKGRVFQADGNAAGRIDIGSNLYFDGTSYQRDSTAQNSSLLSIIGGDFNFRRALAAANPATLATTLYLSSSGTVGIGTTSPAAAFHVLGNSSREVARFQGSNDVSNNRNYISIYTTNPGYWWEISNQDINGAGSQNSLAFRERSGSGASIERVYFATGGNVGIGTMSTTHKLTVAGDVRATSFIADTNTYADFVFKPDYELPALSEVEAHIKERGHLPGIPSEAEARAHGIDLASMQVKLLQKIEELTLHQIAQEKQFKQLQNENTVLRQRIEQLEEKSFP